MNPALSVLLPVYNCPRYVGAAIESILSQTFCDFEFLIIDDGSTDETSSVLKQYSDPRIRHIRQENKGLAGTLNAGIGLARGKYIARQDQDDISLPERFERQFAYLEENPDCGLLGTWARIMETDHLAERFHRHPSDPSELRYQLLFNNPFVHSSVMIRKSVLDAVGGYSTDPERQPPEDYELWSRILQVAGVANLPEVLLYYREIPGSMSRVGPSPFQEKLVRISSENIARDAGAPEGDIQAWNAAALTHGACGLLKKKPDFVRMKELLTLAILRNSAPDGCATLLALATNHISALHGTYFLRNTLLGKMLRAQGPARNFAKNAYRLLGKITSLRSGRPENL